MDLYILPQKNCTFVLREATHSKGGQIFVMKKDYKPSESEPFMNVDQLNYFKSKILTLKEKIVLSIEKLEDEATAAVSLSGDIVDQATEVADSSSVASLFLREQATLESLEKALARIENGTYGYCEMTGNPISIARLEARPTATLSIEAQEAMEIQARMSRVSRASS